MSFPTSSRIPLPFFIGVALFYVLLGTHKVEKILVPIRGWVSRHSTYFGGWVSQRCTRGITPPGGGWVKNDQKRAYVICTQPLRLSKVRGMVSL